MSSSTSQIHENGQNMTTLDTALSKITAGDYVTARGTDTRGHEVTRTGTLLAPPKPVKAQLGGRKTDAVRLCIGLAGTHPSQRSTWTTLFPDSGFVELTRKPTSNDWTNGPLSKVPGMRTADGVLVRFGGKGGKRSPEPVKPVLARIRHERDGKYEICDVATSEVLLTVTWQTAIWWAPAPDDEPGIGAVTAEGKHGTIAEAAASTPSSRTRRGVLYEGWLSAEEAELGRVVVHLTSGQVIGWLAADGQFRPAG
ncbi:hypothetical protein ABZ410_08330 [Streptomyces cinnamoneus]|uniref:hypothetical protein n=1 Tax=Streptomyces cinnamoneus TaxID=53446 RepID=UPI0033D2F1AB